jgi:hypothetical protein
MLAMLSSLFSSIDWSRVDEHGRAPSVQQVVAGRATRDGLQAADAAVAKSALTMDGNGMKTSLFDVDLSRYSYSWNSLICSRVIGN